MAEELDPHTLRVAASLARSRIANLPRNPRLDGLERLGATRALTQLATDLEISAEHVGPPRRRSRGTGS